MTTPPLKQDDSVFNMAVAYLGRLNQLLMDASNCSRLGMFEEWKLTLYEIFRQLYPKMTEQEITDCNELLRIANMQTRSYMNKRRTAMLVSHKEGANIISAVSSSYYMSLHNMEIKLMCILKRTGLLEASPEDPKFALFKR